MPRKSKLTEYRGMTDEHLGLTLKELEKNLFHLRFQSATDRLETPGEIRKTKRDIARIKTLQHARQREAAKGTK
jgi:large subunit ribosomal protein L29